MKVKKKILFLNVDIDVYNFLIRQISKTEFIVDVYEYDDRKLNIGLIGKIKKYDYVFIDKNLKVLSKKKIKDINIAYIDYNQDFFSDNKITQNEMLIANLNKIYTYDSSKYNGLENIISIGNIYNDITRMIVNEKKDISDYLMSEILKDKVIISISDKGEALKLKRSIDLEFPYEVFWNIKNIKENNLQSENYVINENLKLYIYSADIIITDDYSIATYAIFMGKRVVLYEDEKQVLEMMRENRFIVDKIQTQEYVMRDIVVDFLDSKVYKKGR